MAAVRVRRAVPGDEGRLRALRLQALSDSPTAFASTYERELARTDEEWRGWLDRGATFFVENGAGDPDIPGHADSPGHADPVGLVAVLGDGRLVSMWLHPSARGSGAADLLMAAAVDWAGQAGHQVLRLCVIKGNIAARRVYERHGFRLTGESCARDPDELTELQMERRLTS